MYRKAGHRKQSAKEPDKREQQVVEAGSHIEHTKKTILVWFESLQEDWMSEEPEQ